MVRFASYYHPLSSYCHKVAIALAEARPWFKFYPYAEAIPAEFL